MGNVGAESDPAEAFTADGLLLDVDRFPIGVVASNVNCAGTTSRSDAISCNIPIASDHVDIISKRLKVIGNTISGNLTSVVQVWSFDVRFLGQMATKATGIP